MKLLTTFASIFLFIQSVLGQTNLVITEINYNMPGNDSLEYIELYNRGASPLNLNGYTFSSGIDYTFGNYTLNAGSYVVLSRFKTFVDNFYSINSIQWTSGALDNAGEKIVIKDPSGNIADSVEYEDSQPWPSAADGTGPSLSLCDPNQNNALGYFWAASSQLKGFFFGNIIFGSPGSSNSPCNAPGEIFPPKVRKAFAISPTVVKIKYSEPVSLSSAQNVSNYTGLGTITSAVRNALDSVTLTLFTPLPVGFVDTLIISNISDTSGNTMTNQKREIIVFNNTKADLIITEILYNPPGKDTLEFIELYNNGSTTAILGGYRFTDGIDYMFPDITLGAGQHIVVARYPLLFNAFFGSSVNHQFEGGLSNEGEKITLKNSIGDVIDSLTYLTTWVPEANQGPSIVLCDYNSPNHIGSNWGYSGTAAGMYEGFPIHASPGQHEGNCTLNTFKATKESTFNIYPNPSTNGAINIDFLSASDRIIRIVDINGKEVYSTSSNDSKIQFDISSTNSGIFHLQITDISTNRYESKPIFILSK